MYYLDNSATTIPHPEVITEIQNLYATCFGNPSSVHPAGQEAERVLNEARKILSAIFNVPLAGIVFCGSGTESDNLAIKGCFVKQKRKESRIIISPLEHAAVTRSCEWLENNNLATVDVVNIDRKTGQVDLQHLADLITGDTRMVSIQHVNSETGAIQNLNEIAKTVKNKNAGILIHSDGVQAFTRIPVNLNELGVDLYSISAHKFHGVKGSGALILNKKQDLEPLIHGGGQEHGFRSGTENIVGVSAMAKAAEIAVGDLVKNRQKVNDFASQCKQSIREHFPDCQISEPSLSIPHIISLYIPGVLGEVLLHHLADREIYVSTGSACNAGSKKLSPVLSAMGYSQERIKGTIRISLAASEIPIDQSLFFNKFNNAVIELRKILE